MQFSQQSRLSFRANNWAEHIPYSAGSATTTPAGSVVADNKSSQLYLDFTRVLGTRGLNQIKAGYAGSGWSNDSEVKNPLADVTGGFGSPNIQLRGLTIGTGTFAPQRPTQDDYSIRDEFSYSFQRGGRHDFRMGGEYIYHNMVYFFCNVCNGQLDARGGPIPANIESLFPDLFDMSTWNLAALSPITVRWRQGIGDFRLVTPRHVYGAWIQDDWGVTSRLTLNLGVRYDVQTNSFENSVGIPPFLPPDRPNDTNNVAPRFGFAFGLTPVTVVRGGVGKYFGDVHNPHFTRAFSQQLSPETPNDGRPDFAANPWNGPRPTYDQVLANLCSTRNVPGCLRRELPFTIFGPNAVIPHSYQASIGLQRQLGSTASVEADYVFTGERNAAWNATGHNVNLSYNPATGANYPFSDISRRPYPDWGRVDNWIQEGARSNYHALSTGFVRRMRNGWQASGTYLLSVTRDAVAMPVSGLEPVTFPLAPDFGGEYSLAAEDQRHRAVFNGIWQVGYGFQLSGLYFYGSGQRYATSYGTDLRDVGGGGQLRLRPNGTVVPRNDFVGEPIHRVDLRVQRTFALGGSRSIAGIIEAFNLFDRANYGNYTTQEVSPAYGRPVRSTNVAYQPRMLQLGFRFVF